MSMHKTTLVPGQLLRLLHMEKSYHGKAGLPGVVQRVIRPSKLPWGNENSCERLLQASDRAPRQSRPQGVIELHRGNELSQALSRRTPGGRGS